MRDNETLKVRSSDRIFIQDIVRVAQALYRAKGSVVVDPRALQIELSFASMPHLHERLAVAVEQWRREGRNWTPTGSSIS